MCHCIQQPTFLVAQVCLWRPSGCLTWYFSSFQVLHNLLGSRVYHSQEYTVQILHNLLGARVYQPLEYIGTDAAG